MDGLDILELVKIIILSIVQGITEWLPISSTGHLIIVEDLLPLASSTAFKELFMVLVQFGSILAVIVLYFNKLNPFASSKSSFEKKATWDLWIKVVIATLPAVVFGFILDDYMDEYFNIIPVIAATLIIYGIGFIWVENNNQGKHSKQIQNFADLSYMTAFKIGLFQALAIIPGTSRSGATIMGGLLLGASRFIAAEFSFFMSVPVMLGASLLKLIKLGGALTITEMIYMAIGMGLSFIVSLLAIKFLISYIKRHDFKVFGYYRIVLGIILVLYSIFK